MAQISQWVEVPELPAKRALCWFAPTDRFSGVRAPFIGTFYPRRQEDVALPSYLGFFQTEAGRTFNVSTDPKYNMVVKWQEIIAPEL